MSTEKEVSKTAIERAGKEVEMQKVITAFTNAGIAVERVTDNGTLAFMITEGELEGRFITVKVVLTKEFDQETGKGFDMEDAINQFNEKIEAREKAKVEAAKKATAKANKSKV